MLQHLVGHALAALQQVQPQPQPQVGLFIGGLVALATLSALGCGWLTRSLASAALGALAGSGLAVALAVTLLRGGYGHESLARLGSCAITDPLSLTPDALANVLLFVPAAFLTVLAIGRPWLVAVAVGIVSVAVEAIQAVEWIGVCDSSDAVHNTVGGLLAALLAARLRASRRRARAVVSGSGACRESC